MDILDIRTRLNELPFRRGRRQVLIGRMSDLPQPEADEQPPDDAEDSRSEANFVVAERFLNDLREQLSTHGLELVHGENDEDELYAVQRLKVQSEVDLSWMGEAMTWSGRIMAVGLEMVLPVVAGIWLDAQFGTAFFAILGLCIGPPLGLWHLLLFTRHARARNQARQDNAQPGGGK